MNESVGRQVGSWILVQQLGRGGNGEVWLARNNEGKTAALKLLHDQYKSPENPRYQRFRHEMQAHHFLKGKPGVLPLVECYLPERPSREDPPWLVTELATGIRDALGEGAGLEAVVGAIVEIAGALTSFHSQGLAHRDIKPSNLYRRHTGEWVIGDFGLVDFPGKETVTETGERLGPTHFIAPEMLQDAKVADGRPADVYSMAKTLWVLSTGQSFPPPGELKADVPQLTTSAFVQHLWTGPIDRLIERATAHDPARRPTMAEVVSELRAQTAPSLSPSSPSDLSDLATRLNQLTEHTRQAEKAVRKRHEQLFSLAAKLETELFPLRAAIVQALGTVASIPDRFETNDGNLMAGIPPDDSIRGETIFSNQRRTLSVYLHGPISISLYTGFVLQLCESGRLRVVAGHTTMTSGPPAVQSGHRALWYYSRVVWPDSVEQEHAFAEAIAGLNENLRPAVEFIVAAVESSFNRLGQSN